MSDDVTPGGLGRRTVLCGAGVVGVAALAGCAGGDDKPAGLAPSLKGKEIAKTADVPVGGGKILADIKVVVTQPALGTFKAFTAVCTHQGCLTGKVADSLIQCPCHGSEFKIADGSVARGPASRPLQEYAVQVKGDGIVLI